MRRVAVLFDNLGPYHVARLAAASRVCDLLAVEFRKVSREYAWGETAQRPFRSVTLDQEEGKFRQRLEKELDEFRPEAVLVPGWGTPEALAALRWCVTQKIPAVVMSESTAWDESRCGWRERIKSRIVRLYAAALVGGKAHREYAERLGVPGERIATGYDAVDNGYFERETERIRSRGRIGRPYFLASARFLPRKNLDGLLRAYAEYVRTAKGEPWRLVILGDGEERKRLEKLANELQEEATGYRLKATGGPSFAPNLTDSGGATEGLREQVEGGPPSLLTSQTREELRRVSGDGKKATVSFEGFRQYGELPGYYAGAGAFVHPAREEPWGLVVNEAMAAGLPVLVSQRCGCAGDLVVDGENGFLLDPGDIGMMAGKLRQMAEMGEEERKRMGKKSREIVARYGPERFAAGLQEAVGKAIRHGNGRAGVVERILLKVMASR